jgi:hypothetical protein
MSYMQFRPKVDAPARVLLAEAKRREILERASEMARGILARAKKFPHSSNILLDKPTDQP